MISDRENNQASANHQTIKNPEKNGALLQNNLVEIEPLKSPAQLLSSNQYLAAAISHNTQRAYQQDIQHFRYWGGLLPTNPQQIIAYLEHYAALLNPRTLQRRLTAIKQWHFSQSMTDPTTHPLIAKTLKGILRIHGQPLVKAPALTWEQLQIMVHYCEQQNTLTDLRNSTLLLLGFFGAFRRSELTAIQFEHLQFHEKGLEIVIPRSKTDTTGEGSLVAIPHTHQTICPVMQLKKWLKNSNIQCGFIFRRMHKNQRLSEAPLASQNVNFIMKTIAKVCRLPNAEKFSSHSLRRGFATAASQKGAPFLTIMRHGRWKHQGTVMGYIEAAQSFENNPIDLILNKSG
ncbi:MAG: site-specific integrase [Gammaproteobacteria bacterium]